MKTLGDGNHQAAEVCITAGITPRTVKKLKTRPSGDRRRYPQRQPNEGEPKYEPNVLSRV
jgi:hypothetical protein